MLVYIMTCGGVGIIEKIVYIMICEGVGIIPNTFHLAFRTTSMAVMVRVLA
jgi:hypothetical protein